MSTHDPDDAELAGTLRASRGLEDAPETLIQRAIHAWRPRAAAAPAAPGPLRRLGATLRFDSLATPAPALGLRAGPDRMRQLLFATEARDVDLRLEPESGGRWRLSGQVLGPDEQGSAALLPEQGEPQQVAWNELAEFAFEPVAGAGCRLLLRGADWELELPIEFTPGAG